MGVGQSSVLYPILSALYLSLIIHILEKCFKILKIPVFILSFIDNRLLIAQSKSLTILNNFLFCSYKVIFSLLEKFGFILEHSKMEVFYFSRSTGVFNLPLLNLLALGGPILWPKNTQRYLGFFFNRKLLFYHYTNYYTNKAISTVKYMKILGNLIHGLIPYQKHLLYRSCILLIAFYRFQLWYYNKVPLLYSLKILNKMQRRAFRSFLNISILWYQSNCRSHPYLPAPL